MSLQSRLITALSAAGIEARPTAAHDCTWVAIDIPDHHVVITGTSDQADATVEYGPDALHRGLLVTCQNDAECAEGPSGSYTTLYESYTPAGLDPETDIAAAIAAIRPTLSAFHTALSRLTAAGIPCTIDTEDRTTDETWASYHCANGAHITWGADSDTGTENCAEHPISSHGQLTAFCASDNGDAHRLFRTGDFAQDTAALIVWISERIAEHGPSRESDQTAR